MYFDEVKYYLTTELAGRVLLGTPPMGWDEDNKELVRSTQYWGVLTNLSDALQFVNDGAELISSAYEALGTETKITLERYVNVGLSGFELDYIGNIDLKTYSFENDKVSVEFLTGGLQSLIESQFDEDFELGRETDINGNEITPLEFKKMFWEGRKILLQTFFETAEDATKTPTEIVFSNRNIYTDFIYSGGQLNQTGGVVANIPVTITAESGTQFVSTANSVNWLYSLNVLAVPNPLGLVLFSTRSTNYKIKGSLSYTIASFDDYTDLPVGNNLFVGLFLQRYEANANNELQLINEQIINLSTLSIDRTGTSTPINASFENIDDNFDVLENQTCALVLRVYGVSSVSFNNLFIFGGYVQDINSTLTLSENSSFAATTFKVMRTHDVGDRLLEIITGKKGLFKSQFFGKQSDGYLENAPFEKTVIASGELIRKIPDQPSLFSGELITVENGKITIALKDIFELNNYFNLGWGIERVGSFEQFVLEEKSYFLKRLIGIELGEVDEFKKNCASEFLYKSLTFGNEKAGDYEEVQGRSEYNVLNTFTTPLQTSDDSYDVQGKVRADLIPAEITRRKQFDKNPSTDTKYDKENFIFHVKDTDADLINIREWQDDFETEPIVYDPQSAGNLLLTPFRSMQRHANFFKSGMIPNNNDLIRYSSTTGNSEIGTQILNEVVRFENGSIVINEMAAAIFKAEYYEFSFPTTHEIRKKLFSKMNGLPVPYFLITFTFREQNYSGWLINVSTNNVGNWKLIKNDN